MTNGDPERTHLEQLVLTFVSLQLLRENHATTIEAIRPLLTVGIANHGRPGSVTRSRI
jgi:hypothetical protein